MAAGFKEDDRSSLGAEWQRRAMLAETNDIFSVNVGAMAIAAGNNGDLLEVLHGTAAPIEEGPENSGVPAASLTVVRLFSAEAGDAIQFKWLAGKYVARGEHDMHPSQEALDTLTPANAQVDALIRHELARTVFDRMLAGHAMARIFDMPHLLKGKIGLRTRGFYTSE